MLSPTELEQLRVKKREIEKCIPEIEQKKEICNQLTENIHYERQKLQSIQREIKFRSNRLTELFAQYRAITEKGAVGSKKQVEEIKTQIIKEKLEELLAQKIPEAGIKTNKSSKNDLKDNEFQNLIHGNIKIVYTKYESPQSKTKNEEEIHHFRISSTSKFSTLKEIACNFWQLENPNDFLLTDDSEAIIYNEEDLINDYMKYYSVRSNMIRLINTNLLKARTKIMPLQEDRFKDENTFKSKSKYEVRKRENNSSSQKVNDFLHTYSCLTPYYMTKTERTLSDKDPNEVKREAKELESSFIMLMLTIALFILTIVFIYKPGKDIYLNLNKKTYITHLLSGAKQFITYSELYVFLMKDFSSKLFSTNRNTGRDLTCNQDFVTIIEQVYYGGRQLFPIEEKSPKCDGLNAFNTEDYLNLLDVVQKDMGHSIISSVHMILSKVNKIDCSKDPMVVNTVLPASISCYENQYGSNTRNKNPIPFQNDFNETDQKLLVLIHQQMANYKSASEAGIHISISSETGTFDGSGYHADLPTNGDYNMVDYLFAFTRLIPVHSEFYSESTARPIDTVGYFFLINLDVRGITFLFNVFFPNEDVFCNVMMHINFYSTSGIEIQQIEVRPFSASLYPSGLIVVDILRLIVTTSMIGLEVYDYFNKKKSLKNLLSVNFVFYLINLGLFIATFIIKLEYCNEKKDDFFNDQGLTYKDGYQLAVMTESTVYLECILLLFIGMKLISFFKLSNFMALLFTIINLSLTMFVQYLVVMIVMFLGFAVIAQILWGPYLTSFNTLGSSFLSVLLFTSGYYDTNLLIYYNAVWAFFFILFFFLFILFLLFSIFNSIFAESLRRTVIRTGYPDDVEVEEWQIRDYLHWVIYFLPEKKTEQQKTN